MRTYKTEIRIWSAIGNTPITGREGAYCDQLLIVTAWLPSPEAAYELTKSLLGVVPHADKAHYSLLNYPNQNLRTNWLNKASIEPKTNAANLEQVLRELLGCCELNLDELDEYTVSILAKANAVLSD